jgi:hypothetical protein
MKTKIAGVLIAFAAIAPAHAERNDVKQLAEHAGISERNVKMILGCRTCYAGYTYTYQRALTKLKRAIGEENYQQLVAGEPVRLDNGIQVQARVATIDAP